MSLPEPRRYTEAEYLAFERAAQTKHEYYRGEIIAMVGGTPAHNRLTAALVGQLYARLDRGRCEVFTADQRVRIGSAGLYAYPDVVVVCGEARFDDEVGDNLLNPTVIFEVLSPSTEAYDRGDKFQAYRTRESLREYVLVSQTAVALEQFTRQEGGLWLLREVAGRDATLELTSIGCAIPLSEVYARVELPPGPSPGDLSPG